MAGNCLAGDSCQFSHDPSTSASALSVSDSTSPYGTPPQIYHLQDQYEQFPSLQSGNRSNSSSFSIPANGQIPTFTPMSQQRTRGSHQHSSSRPQSRPTSRHQHRPDAMLSAPSVDDPEVFPTLASLNAKRASKHHGQRSRHSHNNAHEKDAPGSLADVVRMSPSPAPNQRKIEAMKKVRSTTSSESAAAQRIPQPQHIPWLETGARANQQYLKYRQEAIKHGSVRNKFLQRSNTHPFTMIYLSWLTFLVPHKPGIETMHVLQKPSPCEAKLKTTPCAKPTVRPQKPCTKNETSILPTAHHPYTSPMMNSISTSMDFILRKPSSISRMC